MGGGNLSKAFTLIEVISAIVIIGIIAIITVPITVRVIGEAKRRSFYATAEGIIKATLESNIKNEEDYGEYFLENEYITFKFSKNEGKEGESVEEINGKKIKLSFEGKSPVGGEVHLYKNGNIEVVNLTDGTYYASKDVDTELVVTSESSSMTRGQLQVAVEQLQQKVKELEAKDKILEDKTVNQDEKDKELENKINNIDVLAKTYPVGSIYISANSTNPSTIFGGTWESFGTGRTLVGVNTANSNFNTVLKTGGRLTFNNSHTHTVASHTHTINSHTHTTGNHTLTIAEMPSHSHKVRYVGNNANGIHGGMPGTTVNVSPDYNKLILAYEGGSQPHNHGNTGGSGTLTTNGNTVQTTSTSGSSSESLLQPYITVYMWKRIS